MKIFKHIRPLGFDPAPAGCFHIVFDNVEEAQEIITLLESLRAKNKVDMLNCQNVFPFKSIIRLLRIAVDCFSDKPSVGDVDRLIAIKEGQRAIGEALKIAVKYENSTIPRVAAL